MIPALDLTPPTGGLAAPLHLGAPLGGALAFLGVERSAALLHGSAGCASAGLSLLVRHFRAPVPIRSVDLDEIDHVLGGGAALARAVRRALERDGAALVGVVTTGPAEARGEDPRALLQERGVGGDRRVVALRTPELTGSFQDGWAAAVEALVHQAARPRGGVRRQLNLLASPWLSRRDLGELRALAESFGLRPIVLPDVPAALGGHLEGPGQRVRHGGTSLEDLRAVGASCCTVALGAALRPAAEVLRARFGVPFQILPGSLGLGASDALVSVLARAGDRSVPPPVRAARARLADELLELTPLLAGRQVAIAAEPDLAMDLESWFSELGAEGTGSAAGLEELAGLAQGADLLVGPSAAASLARRRGVPLWRAGLPVTDRLDTADRLRVGYEGARRALHEVGNLLLEGAAGRAWDPPSQRPVHDA